MRIVPHRTTAAPEILIDANFGAAVRAARKARGLSQWDLARAVDVSQATISAIETGKQGQSSTVVLDVCRVLDLPPPMPGQPAELRRWLEVGRVLHNNHATLFSYHLDVLEQLVASLAAARQRSGGGSESH